MTQPFNIAICGAGPVGMACALLLVKHGVVPQNVVLIDAKTLDQAIQDPRTIALSYGSRQILESVNAWPIPATDIHQIHVSRRGHFGRTLIDHDEYKLPALGYVARYGDAVSVLAAAINKAGIEIIRPTQIQGIDENAARVKIQCTQAEFTTNIAVLAEGGVFAEQTKKSLHKNYTQTAIITTVQTSHPIAHRAYERFTGEGPLALLPIENQHYAVVWCVRPDNAERLLKLDQASFLNELQQAFGDRLGRFLQTSACTTYPLGLNAQSDASARTIAIGNAAQTLHPVAGQGLNLGLRDAATLAKVLAHDTSPDALTQYRQNRQRDRHMVVRMTDTLARIFAAAPDGTLSQSMLGVSLGLLDIVRPAKHTLAEWMMFGRR